MRKEVGNSMILLVSTGVSSLLALAYSLYVFRVLGPGEASVFAAMISVVAFGQLALGPINATVARFTARYRQEQQLASVRMLATKTARKVAVYGAIFLLLAIPCIPVIARFLNLAERLPLIVALVLIYLTLILSVGRGVLRGMEAFGRLGANTILEAAIRIAVGLSFLAFAATASSALFGFFGGLVVVIAFSVFQIRPLVPACGNAAIDIGEIKQFGRPMLILMLISAGFQNVDMIAVKHFCESETAGQFGAAFNLSRMVAVLVSPFTTLLLPMLTVSHLRGESVIPGLARVTGYFLALAAVPLIIVWFWSEPLMVLLYEEAFQPSAAYLPGLFLVRLLSHLCHMTALACAAMHRFKFLFIYVAGLAVCCILLSNAGNDIDGVIRIMAVTQIVVLVLIWLPLLWPGSTPTTNSAPKSPE